jgi:hypothetical protein
MKAAEIFFGNREANSKMSLLRSQDSGCVKGQSATGTIHTARQSQWVLAKRTATRQKKLRALTEATVYRISLT